MLTHARIPGALAVAFTITGLVLALCGLPLVFLWAAALAASALLLSRWLSAGLTLAVTSIGFMTIEDLLLVTGSFGGPGILATQCIAWTAIGAGAGIASAVIPAPARSWTGADRRLALAAGSGTIVVVLLTIVGTILPGAVHLAWAMNDDSVRDLFDARLILASHGTGSTPGDPTPLPFGITAANMLPGRGSMPPAGLLRFDVTRMAEVWIAVAAGTCLLLGAIVARGLRGVRASIAIPLTVIVSLAGLSWWVIGIQLADGYLNAGFAIIVLLAAWHAYLESERRPLTGLIVLTAAAIVMVPTWSPMIICVGALAVLVLVRLVARLSQVLAVIVVVALAVLAIAAVFTVGLRSNDLSKDGGFPELSTPIVFAFVALIAIVLIVDALRMGLRHVASGTIALTAAGVVGMAYLLYQRRDSADLFGYYPEKFSWLMAVLLAVVCITMISSLLVRRPVAGRAQRAVLASLVVVVIAVAVVAGWATAPERLSPVFGILAGKVFDVGDTEADTVFRLVNEDRNPDLRHAAPDFRTEWIDYYVGEYATHSAPSN
ncbi:MAG: hypothetical protein V4479_02895 [Actinomycetota bacterium]